ncbi:Cna B-type protein [Candidatus Koribacter versatilis Ellin345]|uniref:Cna B-type protein n=1 Tax=Koribacter versatilis (strain Ellin345) TaxID=204669 RepID=Q1IT79_KORVE|nr:TonB-dependent receptor [Candidatus Koribacter versatilis]ABF39921.1 Cna B-type protein [Candidatus Koribacter versatilis Ellin345]
MKRVAAVLALCFLSLLAATPAFAQAVFGNIFGTVTDPQGAAVPGATVTVSNVRKGTSDTATTNESGNYQVTHLIPDEYSVKVEAKGFKTFEQKSVSVSADQSARLDAQVQLGSESQTVEVTSEAPQLQTDRADVAITFNQTYVEDLPVLNRNFTQFELMSPGTQKLVGWSHASTENPQGSQQIFVNGQHFSGTNFELDGTDNQDPILGIIVVNPNLDAVTETKIALQNYDAEMGKAVAGFVTAQTKSGSNEIHGSAFYFRRSDANQARDPFTQFQPDAITGRMIPYARWQQFGGSVGGPIIKNKLFFFGDYQGTRQVNGQTQVLTVPTAKTVSSCAAALGNPALNCDLSDYLGNVGGGGQVYMPNSSNSSTFTGGTKFDGNLIPGNLLSPQAVALLKLFPAPNSSGIDGKGVLNNFVGGGSGPFNQNSFDTRIDYNMTDRTQLFGRFSLDYFNLSGAPAFTQLGSAGFGLNGLAGSSITHNYSLSSTVTHTFSNSLLADFRFGWFRYNPQTHKYFEGKTPASDVGIPGANLGDLATSGWPAFNMDTGADGNGSGTGTSVSDFGESLNIGRCNCPLTEKEDQFQGVNNWTKIHGNHTFKFGADIRSATNLRVPSDANRTGQFNFNHLATSNGGVGGLALGTFLLGDVTTYDRFASTSLDAAEHQWRFFFYGQDTWRITPKLTLNIGLRWEDYTPEAISGKDLGGLGVITAGGNGTLTPNGAVVRVAGEGPYDTSLNVNHKLDAFAPRFGLAYQFDDKTVIRMGYGRSFDMGVFGSNFGHAISQNLPVLVHQNISASSQGLGSDNYVTAFTLGTGAPPATYPVPVNGVLPIRGPDNSVDPRIRPGSQTLPTIDVWNLTIQRQLTATTTLEIAYVGNKGSHTFAGNGPAYNVNQPSIVGLAAGVPQANRRPFYNAWVYPDFTDPNTGQPLVCCSSDLGNYFGNNANSLYNALQVKAEKRMSNGLQFITHYTWSRSLRYDNNYFVDDPHVAYGPDNQNRSHVFVANVVYDLPFGRGKKFAGGVGKAADLAIGGWEFSSTTNWSSGLPFTPGTAFCNNDVGVCRPDKAGAFALGAGKFDPAAHSVTYYTPENLFTGTGAWSAPVLGTIGNSGWDSLYGPRLFTTDATLMKNFAITERVKAQFRMDVFNLFNHPVLGFNSNQGNTCVLFYNNGNPADTTNSNCGSGGKITDIEADTTMRALQFAVRINF